MQFLFATVVAQDVAMLIALIVFIITPKEGRLGLRWLGMALLCGLFTDLWSMVSYFALKKSANPIIAIGSLLGTVLYLLLYKLIFKSDKIRAFLVALLIFNVCFSLINMFFIQGLEKPTSYSFTIRSLTFIFISLLYFYVLLRKLPIDGVMKSPIFWINTAFLLYYSGVFFQWLLMDYLINQMKGDVVNTYLIKNDLGIIYYLMIAFGLWLNRNSYILKSHAD